MKIVKKIVLAVSLAMMFTSTARSEHFLHHKCSVLILYTISQDQSLNEIWYNELFSLFKQRVNNTRDVDHEFNEFIGMIGDYCIHYTLRLSDPMIEKAADWAAVHYKEKTPNFDVP